MSFEQRDMSGSLFRNDRKEQDNHPDHTGTAKIGGQEYYISAWVKQSQAGKKYFSLSFKPKLQSERMSPPTGGRNDPRPQSDPAFDRYIEGENDSIPF